MTVRYTVTHDPQRTSSMSCSTLRPLPRWPSPFVARLDSRLVHDSGLCKTRGHHGSIIKVLLSCQARQADLVTRSNGGTFRYGTPSMPGISPSAKPTWMRPTDISTAHRYSFGCRSRCHPLMWCS